jgi:myo-inositol-1-phosphate synthase
VSGLPVKVAIAGVGNCTSVFLQGLKFYNGQTGSGLWHPNVAGFKPSDIRVVAAFDVDSRKVGLELSKAIFAPPNVARRYLSVPRGKIVVDAGISSGHPAPHLREASLKSSSVADVASRLEDSGAEIFLNLISSGSDASSEAYAKAALRAGCAFVNGTPSLVLKRGGVANGFQKAKLPLVGDDLMSQFGGTVFHKGLLGLMVRRGVRVSKSYQLDVGGGSETQNTIDENIKMAKREVKTTSVASEVPYKFETIAGTTDFVDYMGNDRTSYFWFEGSTFMDTEISVDIYLRSADGANAGNILLDVIRAAAWCTKTGKLGAVNEICAYGFKSPPKRIPFEEAYENFAASFIR